LQPARARTSPLVAVFFKTTCRRPSSLTTTGAPGWKCSAAFRSAFTLQPIRRRPPPPATPSPSSASLSILPSSLLPSEGGVAAVCVLAMALGPERGSAAPTGCAVLNVQQGLHAAVRRRASRASRLSL